jgi:cytochrome c biogenesis protein CcmG, thiol:disulfide interchange protein DsbE
MLRRLTIAGVWVGLLGLLGLLAWGMFRVSAADTLATSAGGPSRVNWDGRALPLRPRPAPELRLVLYPGLDGVASTAAPAGAAGDSTILSVGALRGRPIVLNFWASWCAPCRQEAEVLEQFAREYGPLGVAFVGVNVWDNADKARAFLAEYGVSYLNGADDAGSAAVDYGLTGLPETYFVDRDGRLVRKFIGPITERALRAALEELLS